MKPDYMSREEVVAALEIKPSTLYAYVSRGLLRRVRDHGRRKSMYLREDVERLAARRPGLPTREEVAAGALRWGLPVISTSISCIKEDGPVYRNRKASELAKSGVSFEAVAHLLLTGLWQPGIETWPIVEMPPDVRRVLSSELRDVEPADISKLFARIVLTLGMKGRGQHEMTVATGECARLIIQTLSGCFGALLPQQKFVGQKNGESVAEHVLRAVGCTPSVQSKSAVNQLLIILADHEMATASFVSRITASTNSDLFCCVASALCAHAGSSMVAATSNIDERLFSQLSRKNWGEMLELAQCKGTTLFGFNHPLYPKGDPRADYLLELSATLKPVDGKVPLLLGFLRSAREESGLQPGIAVALAVFARAIGMPPGSAAALWMLSRTAGWMAHAIEQRAQAFMLRPRARYASPLDAFSMPSDLPSDTSTT